MLIVLEGIDGAGKTTLAPMLYKSLAPSYERSVLVTGKHFDVQDPSVARHLETLRNLAWTRQETGADLLGARHWLALIASWYQALQQCVLRHYRAPSDLVVVDGWFFRNLVKTRVRLGCTSNELAPVFAGVCTPDHTILVDAKPETIWSQRADFKTTELGRWDGYEGDPRCSFIAYQTTIREHMLSDAQLQRWHVVQRQVGTSPLDTLAELRALLAPAVAVRRCGDG